VQQSPSQEVAGCWLKSATSLSLKKLAQTLRGYRKMWINVAGHGALAAVPHPPKLSEKIKEIMGRVTQKLSKSVHIPQPAGRHP